MLIRQAFYFELRPNGGQEQQMRRFAGACRFVYNKALALQKERYERGEKKLGYAGLYKLLTEWRNSAETAWLAEVPVHPLQQALKDLERAYANFFAKRADFPRLMQHVPSRIDSRRRRKPLQRYVKPRKPKQVKAQALKGLACSTRERIRNGMRRYIVTFIDPVLHFAFAVGLPSKHARYTARALDSGLSLLPHTPKIVLSDNGSEFEADFAQLLEDQGIKRWYTYPKTPKMNAHAERFNRTIQESFVDYHEDLLFTDLALFNRKLADWLVFYNTERPHHSLSQQSPLSFLLQHQLECQRDWTHTESSRRLLFPL
jgi:hypothetical protein